MILWGLGLQTGFWPLLRLSARFSLASYAEQQKVNKEKPLVSETLLSSRTLVYNILDMKPSSDLQ